MEKRDARKISNEAQYELRCRCLRMLWQGMKQVEVVSILEVSRTSVVRWRRRYRREGMNGLKVKKRDRRHGQKRRLDREHDLCYKQPGQSAVHGVRGCVEIGHVFKVSPACDKGYRAKNLPYRGQSPGSSCQKGSEMDR